MRWKIADKKLVVGNQAIDIDNIVSVEPFRSQVPTASRKAATMVFVAGLVALIIGSFLPVKGVLFGLRVLLMVPGMIALVIAPLLRLSVHYRGYGLRFVNMYGSTDVAFDTPGEAQELVKAVTVARGGALNIVKRDSEVGWFVMIGG